MARGKRDAATLLFELISAISTLQHYKAALHQIYYGQKQSAWKVASLERECNECLSAVRRFVDFSLVAMSVIDFCSVCSGYRYLFLTLLASVDLLCLHCQRLLACVLS